MDCVATFPTPYGDGSVVVSGGRLEEVRLPYLDERSGRPVEVPGDGRPAKTPCTHPGDPSCAAATWWAREIASFFDGGRREWTADELGLDDRGFTPFQADVYRSLLSVPAGSVVSYGELARMAGYPGAARAVGTAMATNPLPIVVPCHRVVLSGGALGRYGFGKQWKSVLLDLESREA